MDDHLVHTIRNHHPPKMDVFPKTFLKIIIRCLMASAAFKYVPPKQQPLPSLLSVSSSMGLPQVVILCPHTFLTRKFYHLQSNIFVATTHISKPFYFFDKMAHGLSMFNKKLGSKSRDTVHFRSISSGVNSVNAVMTHLILHSQTSDCEGEWALGWSDFEKQKVTLCFLCQMVVGPQFQNCRAFEHFEFYPKMS